MADFRKIQEEFVRCFSDNSRIYMIEHYLKTFDMNARQEIPFQLFPRQKDFLMALRDHRNVVTTKPRQAGITTTTAAFLACTLALASSASPETVLVIGNKLDLAQQMITKVRDFLYQLPRWFFGEDYYSPDPDDEVNKKDIFKVRNQSNLVLFNGSKIVAKSSGPNAARGVSSVSYLVFDEAAFIEKGDEVYTQAVATCSTGGKIIMISTPHGKDPLYYKTCSKAKSGENNFFLVELKWYHDPRYNKYLEWYKKDKDTGAVDIIKEQTIDSKGSVAFEPKKWEKRVQEGYMPRSPWYIGMCQSFNNDEQKIAQELDVSFLGSAANVVAPEFIEMQEKLNMRTPLAYDPLEENTWIWKEPIDGHRYIMGVDNSRGDSADRSAIEIIDLDGRDENGQPILEQVLEYHGKKTGDDIGEMTYVYGLRYNEAFIVVESIGGQGDATLLTLQKLGYQNLYYDDPTMKTYTIAREVSSLNVTNEGRLPGFHTSSVRLQMLTNFASMVRTNAFKIRSSRVISELETWIYKGEAARIDHMTGAHDDTLTCLAMAIFVMQFSMLKQEEVKKRDTAILDSWVNGKNDSFDKPWTASTPVMDPDEYIYVPEEQKRASRSSAWDAYSWVLR